MEYIEGPTLAERSAAGRIPLEEALAIAQQIASSPLGDPRAHWRERDGRMEPGLALWHFT